jgi:hypothetical protein
VSSDVGYAELFMDHHVMAAQESARNQRPASLSVITIAIAIAADASLASARVTKITWPIWSRWRCLFFGRLPLCNGWTRAANFAGGVAISGRLLVSKLDGAAHKPEIQRLAANEDRGTFRGWAGQANG